MSSLCLKAFQRGKAYNFTFLYQDMRYGRTHDILTGYTMPSTKKKRIRQINHEIDNPSPAYKLFKKNLGLDNKALRNPYLTYYPHRKKAGHDLSDMVYFTAKYGREGWEAWMNHQAQDMFSDLISKNFGTFGRNILEDGILEFSKKKYRKNKTK